MKKLKQFYKNNEKTLLVCSGVAIGVYLTTAHSVRVIDGLQLVNADVYAIPEKTEKVLRVTFKNGTVRDYIWNYAEIPSA